LHTLVAYRYHPNEHACAFKQWATRLNTTSNKDRTSVNVTKTPLTNDELCAKNTGVLAVLNGSADATHVDILVYNHAAFVDPIVECTLTVDVPTGGADKMADLGAATVQRIDEDHANPLAAWIAMGTPDYTTAEQNAALLRASTLVVEKLSDVASSVGATSFTFSAPPHSVAAVRVPLK
jgi:hypothetical protein